MHNHTTRQPQTSHKKQWTKLFQYRTALDSLPKRSTVSINGFRVLAREFGRFVFVMTTEYRLSSTTRLHKGRVSVIGYSLSSQYFTCRFAYTLICYIPLSHLFCLYIETNEYECSPLERRVKHAWMNDLSPAVRRVVCCLFFLLDQTIWLAVLASTPIY